MIYWDTSAIVPLYTEEATSTFWENQLLDATDTPASSALAITEFSYALHHKVLRKNLDSSAVDGITSLFTQDHEAGRWRLVPLGSDVIAASLQVAKEVAQKSPPVVLRSLDGLHLGAALTLKRDTIATGDQRLATAAKHIGLKTIFPHT